MKIDRLTHADTRNEIICDAFLLTGIETFAQLVAVHDDHARRFPGQSLLFSLDDFGQAAYTCSHAIMTHDLDDTDGHDLSLVDPAAFEDGEHLGYLSTPSEFFIRRDNFIAKSANAGFEDACARGLRLDDEELDEILGVNAAPELVLDDRIVMWVVPVSKQPLALCAFPNGYFSADLNPFENYALAVRLQERYGYALFGIGASWIGFRRHAPLDRQAALALADDIGRLYHLEGRGESAAKIMDILEHRDWLFLRYTE
ncbi:hypothetical protein OU994_10825 [Pseudoduganella sp. SL102]|uniref:hypothetical protein n=1 Tax=Pseudoduganella sp. SL102 TaxID=2995154 RepID=UPI00248B01F1|nr:hypothetical protein [Pseudoduganella sp. SL102]WBS04728.1 hypothetical protein OU994_10825 [Pseudoduganella sp. SL102]